MKNKLKLKFSKYDLIIIAAALIAAAAVFLLTVPKSAEGRLFAEVTQNGDVLYSLPLDTDTERVIGGDYENTLVIKDGTVCFSSATCPNGDCVRTGTLSKAGQLAVCLPNGVAVRIVGGTPDVDAIAG